MSLIAYAGPFFALFIFLELWWDRRQGTGYYRLNDSVSSLSLGILSTGSKLVIFDLGALVLLTIGDRYGLLTISVADPLAWVVTFIAYDFLYYWFHRLSHERQLFWGAHVAHHQSEEFNLTTALRQTSMSFFYSWLFFIPCFLMGVPGEMFFTVASVNLLYQFWVHTRHIDRLGWFDHVFVSPSNHRVHHARNVTYLDRNYGGVFILWDKWFGTFEDERKELPVEFGIRKPLHSWNPLRANLHIFQGMLQDMFATKGVARKLSVLTARTGWRPDDLPAIDLPETPAKYDPQCTGFAKQYSLAALAAMYVWGSYYIFAFLTATWMDRFAGLVFIVLVLLDASCVLEAGERKEPAFTAWARRLGILILIAYLAYLAPPNSVLIVGSYVLLAAVFALAWCFLGRGGQNILAPT
ncbi:MAG: sterol desaturase family protein [Pseudomonadales bacterium]